MRRLFFMLALLLAAGLNPLQASLGGTEARVEAGYGKPITVEKGRTDRESIRLYSHAGYRITVKILDGKSGFEEFTKDDLRNKDFSDEEERLLLTANCMGLEWNRLRSTEKEPMMEKNWELGTAGKPAAVASSRYPYTVLVFATAEFVHYNSQFEKAPKETAEPVEP